MKMRYKKILMLGTILILSIFLIGIISAQGVSYCCEKTIGGGPGGWCINAPENKCDTGNNCGGEKCRMVPTSCEATSYCRLGVCINSKEGTCMPNTPQRVCDANDGVWDERDKDEIPQCQLGCCLIGEQAAFVTLTRCKKLSSDYGLEINYRMDIQSETECIAMARPKVKGACVYEKEFERTCEFLTKKECQERGAEFHEGYLCSANSLTTNCAPRWGTTCVEGRDEVYSLDSCGNLGNVYDAEQWDDNDEEGYWGRIMAPVCGSGSNAGSRTCGDCDYFAGSTCKKTKRGESVSDGDYICKDLACYEGSKKIAEHGETWCADAEGISTITVTGGRISSSGEDLPGGRYFRMVCYNGEVSVEPCADYRQEICIQSEVGTFKTAACRVNMWQDCYAQDNEKDCTNRDKRDCKVQPGFSILKDENGVSLFFNEDGETKDASCVPLHNPGFNFWDEGGDAESTCSMASATCVVDYGAKIEDVVKGEKGEVVGDWKCIEKCEAECWINDPLYICESKCREECPSKCVDDIGDIKKSWLEEMNEICIAMGDCGMSKNYIGEYGYYDDLDDFIVRSWEGEDEEEED